jgi:hypothetical protein
MMLTAMVNIAVFAAFSFRVGHVLLVDAAFKPVCAIRQRDSARSGWQTRQRSGKKRQEVARWVAKAARFGWIVAASRLSGVRLPADEIAVFAGLCGW